MEVLSGANTYSGLTSVNGGTLMANSTGGSATGFGQVIVNSGGYLAGTGMISASVLVNAGGGFGPGNPLGTLTLKQHSEFGRRHDLYTR